MVAMILATIKTLLIALLLSLAACTQTPRQDAKNNQPIKTYRLTGEIVGMDNATQVVTVKHTAIVGFMEAMTMGFPVKEKAEFEKLKPGQKVTAEVNAQGDDFWLSKITQQP